MTLPKIIPRGWVDRGAKPAIVVTGKQLDKLVRETLEVLASDDQLYTHGGLPARVEVDECGRARIRRFDKASLTAQMGLLADWFTLRRGRRAAACPCRRVAEAILTLPPGYYPFPELKAILQSPIVRADGIVLKEPGYDSETSLIYSPPPGFHLPEIPENPTANDVRKAVDELVDIIDEFPFADEASRANTIGMFVSPFTRYLAPGPRPLALLEARVMGTGKTLLAEILSIITTGEGADLHSPPSENAEWRKQITSILLRGSPIVIWDNLDTVLDSGELAKLLTAEHWADRQLGVNNLLQLPVLCDFAITGNNIQLGGDLPRRCYRIRIDAKTDEPFLRTEFKYKNLKHHVLEVRPVLIASILTLIHAWVLAGRPKPHSPIIGSFENWSFAVGGILEHAGVGGFLGNFHELLEDGAPEVREIESYFKHLYDQFGEKPFSSSEVFHFIQDGLLDDTKVQDFIPNDLQEFVTQNGKFQMRLGRMFRKYTERPFGPDGLRIVNVGEKRGAILWRFAVNRGAK